jgi:DNA-directed RNA polymerase subunit RPC12/RpoP
MTTEQVCTDCGATFESEDALSRHRLEAAHRSAAEMAYKCDECGDEFSRQEDLERHLTDVHAAEPDAPIR